MHSSHMQLILLLPILVPVIDIVSQGQETTVEMHEPPGAEAGRG